MDHWRKNSTNNSRRLSHCFGLSNSTEYVERTKQSSLYVEKFRNMRLITSTNVRQRRQLAIPGQHSIHYYIPRKELSPFSAHFLRVCACMILHTTGFTAIQILFKLCWRPLAGVLSCYLHNLMACLTITIVCSMPLIKTKCELPAHLLQL